MTPGVALRVGIQVVLNDSMPVDLRQKLLSPLIVKLGCTNNAEEIERQRAEFIVFETCRRISRCSASMCSIARIWRLNSTLKT